MPPLASSTISIQAALVSLPSRTVLHTKTKTSSSPVSSCSPTRPSSLRQTPPGRAPCRLGSCQGEPGRAFLVCTSEERRFSSTWDWNWVKLALTIMDILLNFFLASSIDASGSIWSTSNGLRFLRLSYLHLFCTDLQKCAVKHLTCISKKIAQPICVAWSK